MAGLLDGEKPKCSDDKGRILGYEVAACGGTGEGPSGARSTHLIFWLVSNCISNRHAPFMTERATLV